MTAALQLLVKSRHCCRNFDRSRIVSKSTVENILDAARNAPSSQNNQPWRCYVIQGEKLSGLSSILVDSFLKNLATAPAPYKNRPDQLDELQSKGIDDYASWWFQEKNGVDRQDQQGRRQLYLRNYEFYGATTHVIVSVPNGAVAGTFLDAGCFIQNMLIAAAAEGLGAIPQYSIAAQYKLIKQYLSIESDDIFVAGISLGYPVDEVIEGPPRHSLDSFVKWYE